MHNYRQTRVLVWLACILVILPVLACTNGETQPDVNLLIDRSVAAHGESQLAQLTTIVAEWQFDDSQVYESRRPAPPWDRVKRWEAYAIDFDSRQYADARFDSAGGYEWITSTVVTTSDAFRLDYRNRSFTETGLGFDDAIADAAALSPLVLLRWLKDHRDNFEYAGQIRESDSNLHVLRIRRNDGSDVEVLLEADTGRIHGFTSGYTDYDGTHIPLHYRYFDWRRSNGWYYPSRTEVRSRGYVVRRASLVHLGFGTSIARHLQIPSGFTQAAAESREVRHFRLEEIADGVFFVGQGVMYQLIVEFDEFLVALDSSSGDVGRRIDAARERIPDKPFRYVLASHHHNDHLHGLDEYVALGATIISAPTHVTTVRGYVQSELGNEPQVTVVRDRFVVSDEGREMHIMDIGPTPHSQQILAAYLPEEEILFVADLFVLGGRRTPVRPAMANGLALYDWISKENLNVRFIVDPHSPLIATLDDLQQAVNEVRDLGENIKVRVRKDLTAWRSANTYVR